VLICCHRQPISDPEPLPTGRGEFVPTAIEASSLTVIVRFLQQEFDP
jgi:hypothetical protein